MRHSSARGGIPGGNPIASVLVVVAGALVIGASIVLGFFAFLALSGIVLVSAAVIGLRTWWLRRQIARGKGPAGFRSERRTRVDVIEGEFREVGKSRDET